MNELVEIWKHVDKVGKRQESFVIMLDHLLRCDKPVIVETGTTRSSDNYEGDGMSSLFFHQIAKMRKGEFHSIDNDPKAVLVAEQLLFDPEWPSFVHLDDGIRGIFGLRYRDVKKIDLLYLDSLDLDPTKGMLHMSCLQCFMEFTSAIPLLKPGSLICVDDNGLFDFFNDVGEKVSTNHMSKGEYIKQYFQVLGITPIFEEYQIIWKLPETWSIPL